MKRISRSKVFIALLTIAVLAGALRVVPMYASGSSIGYVALGDSIGTGYGLATPDSNSSIKYHYFFAKWRRSW